MAAAKRCQVIMLRLVVFLFLILSSQAVSSTDSQNGYAFILARPVSAALANQASGSARNERVMLGHLYQVTLGSVRVVDGDFNPTRRLVVELSASHRESITNSHEIYLLLDTSNPTPKVLFWGVPQKIGCVPERVLVQNNLGHIFEGFSRYDASRCESLDVP